MMGIRIGRLGGRFVRRRYVRGMKQGARRLTAGTLAAIFALTILITYAVQVVPTAHALTGNVVPDGDIARGWAACTGTGCASAHYTTVDEGTTASASDYFNTGTSSTSSETNEHSMDNTITGASSVTSVAVNVNAWRISTGSTADTIDINLRIGGSLQTAGTCSPGTTSGAGAWCTAVTFNGTWSQSDLNGMQVLVTRNIVGTGPGGGRDDDMAVAAIYAVVTYTQSPSFTQASHRWFDNVDGVSPTDPLAAQDTAASQTSPTGIARLRLNLGIATVALGSSGQNFKLQVAERGSDGLCDTSFTNETYGDLGQSTTWTRARINSSGSGWSDRGDHASVVFDNKMWVVAGWDGSLRRNDIWNSTDGTTWTQVTPSGTIFSARQAPAMAVLGSKMYLVGGFDGSYKNDVWSTTDGVNWSSETPSDGGTSYSGRYYAATTVLNGRLYIISGTDASTKFNDVWSTDGSGTWQRDTASAFSTGGRNGHAAVTFNNEMWVMGGTNGSRVNEVWRSSNGSTWTQVTSPSIPWSARNVHAAVKDGKMWIYGGYTGSTYLNDVWVTTDGTNWSEYDSAADWGGRGFMTALTYNGYLWAIGGNASSPSYIGEVWYGAALSDIGFYDNPTPANAANISAITGDPTAGGTIRPQNYQETGTFTNAQAAIAIGEYGVWDFSLYQSNENAFGKTYCFRVVKSDGSVLNTYSTVPQLTACGAPPNASQMRHGGFFCAESRRPFTWSR